MKRFSPKLKRALALMLSFVMILSVLTIAPSTEASAASKYVKSLKLNKKSITLTAGQKNTKVKATVKVVGSASKKVTIKQTSKTKKVVTAKVGKPDKKGVSKITLTAKKVTKKQSVTLTIQTKDKDNKKKVKTAKLKVTVKPAAATTEASTTEAPTTQAPTTAAPTTAAPTTPEGPKFDKVTAGMVGKMEVGSTAKITVAHENAVDPEVTYSVTSGEGIVTVDANGNVTAVKEGSATITVKVKAKNGENSTTVNVEVVKEKELGYTLTATSTDVPMSIGESKDLKDLEALLKATENGKDVTLANLTRSLVWTLKEGTCVELKNGKINALAEGSATITAAIQGTKAEVSFTVTVASEENSVKIVSLKQTAVDELTLVLNRTVELDEDGLKIEVKESEKVQEGVKATLESDKKTVKLQYTYTPKATYYVTISGSKYNILTSTADCTIEEQKLDHIALTTKYVSLIPNAKIHIEAQDQWNQPMPESGFKATDVTNWVLDSSNNKIIIDKLNRRVYADHILIDTSMDNGCDFDDEITIKGIYKKDNTTYNIEGKVTLTNLKLASVKFTDPELITDADNKKVKTIPPTQTICELQYYLEDSAGQEVDYAALKDDSEGGADAYSSPLALSLNEEAEKAGVTVEIEDTNKLTVKNIPENYKEDITVTVSVQNNSDEVIIRFGKIQEPAIIKATETKMSVHMGEKLDIPVSIYDEAGNPLTNVSNFDRYFSLAIYANTNTDKDIEVAKLIADPVYKDGKITIDATRANKQGTIKLEAKTSTGTDQFTIVIEIVGERQPALIEMTESPKLIYKGASATFSYKITDQEGVEIPKEKLINVQVKATLMDTAGNYIDEPVTNELGKVKVTAKEVQKAVKVQLSLVDNAEQPLENARPTTITFDVIRDIENAEVVINDIPDDKTYEAGTSIKFTVTVQYQAGNSWVTNTDYNETQTITLQDGKEDYNVTLAFHNGVATDATILATKVGDESEELTYKGNLKDANQKDIPVSVGPFKVKAAKVANSDPEDVEKGSTIDETGKISLRDAYGNVVLTDKRSERFTIIIKDSKTGSKVNSEILPVGFTTSNDELKDEAKFTEGTYQIKDFAEKLGQYAGDGVIVTITFKDGITITRTLTK